MPCWWEDEIGRGSEPVLVCWG